MTNIITSTNPSRNYEVIDSISSTSESEIIQIVENAKKSQKNWSTLMLSERVWLLRELYEIFVSNKEQLAMSIAREMGMPIKLARDEVGYGLSYFLWYLQNTPEYLSPEITYENETELHTVSYEPRWVVAAITPWNYPFMLCIWSCIQPLIAWNAVIWKISKEVILTGKLIGDIIESSSLPKWVWSEIYGDGKLWDFLTDQDIDGITFTGSTNVGNSLSKKAYEKQIPAVMELGGSAPWIVCEDADIDKVIETIYFMRFSNSGQMCDGLKRLMVHRSRYNELLEKLSSTLQSKKFWDSLDENTDIGPLVSARQCEILEEQFQDAMQKWAIIESELLVSDTLQGAYFAPKILSNISLDMRIWREEVFGPILPIVIYDTIEEAIKLANDTSYGLGAYVFTESRDNFAYLARQIESGMVQMNNVNYCIPADPFGGYKASWIGREHGKWGFHEMTQVKVTSMPK